MTSELTQAALEPCPFCGGKAEWKDDPKICGVPFGLVVDHKPDCFFAMPMSEEAMLAAWNTRLTAQSGEGRSGAGEDAIDWTSPLELLDGTPVRLTRDEETGDVDRHSNPDPDGDYWIEREDGHRIASTDRNSRSKAYRQLCVHANGCEEGTGTIVVRNRAAFNARQSGEGEDAAEVASELSARDRRTLTDTQRLIWRDDVEGICPTPDMCFEYGDHVRCGPCAIKQAAAHGVASDMSLPSLPEVARLRREAGDLSRKVEALAVDLDAYVLVMTNNPDLAIEVGDRIRAALRATDDAGGA